MVITLPKAGYDRKLGRIEEAWENYRCCKLGEKWLQASSWTGTCQKIPNFQASKEVDSSLTVQ